MASNDDAGGGRFWTSTRFGLAVIAFFGFVNVYAQRVNLSVAMVCMLNHTAVAQQQRTPTTDGFHTSIIASKQCDPLSNQTAIKEDGSFTWSKSDQGIILGSFFWGYLITQVPGGVLAERFGGKHVFLWFMLVSVLCTLLCPIGAVISPKVLMILRIGSGVGQGVVFPAMHSMWSNWAPPLERSKLTGFSYAGAQIGNVITLPLSAVLCDQYGWQSVFYFFGTFGVLWCVAWLLLVSDTPAKHSRISAHERAYIKKSLAGQMDKTEEQKHATKPWGAFFKSPAVWAIIVGHTCGDFGTYLVLTNLPTFMKEVLYFDIKSNGLLSAIPYIAYWGAINIAGFFADFLRRRRIISTTRIRKAMMLFALCGQSVFLVLTGYCSCEYKYVAVALVTIAQGISGFQYAGFVVNYVDIAPQYAGTLFGIGNTVATISGVIAPFVASALTPNKTIEEWRLVFWTAACVLVFGAVSYAIFGSGELQPWAVHQKTAKQEEDEEDRIPMTDE